MHTYRTSIRWTYTCWITFDFCYLCDKFRDRRPLILCTSERSRTKSPGWFIHTHYIIKNVTKTYIHIISICCFITMFIYNIIEHLCVHVRPFEKNQCHWKSKGIDWRNQSMPNEVSANEVSPNEVRQIKFRQMKFANWSLDKKKQKSS